MQASLTTHLTNQRLVNFRNLLNYQFTPKNNVYTVVILFIVIMIQFFFLVIISLIKRSNFSIYKPFFFFASNVKLLSLSNNKVSLTEKQIILEGMVTNSHQQC